jgi:flagellar hook-basal body complex protein FliE
MAGIAPVSNISAAQMSSAVAAAPSTRPAAGNEFGEMLRGALERVETDQHKSSQAIEDLLSGRSEDILPVVTAVAKADMSFKLLVGVRNKVIEAYRQTMNMQI